MVVNRIAKHRRLIISWAVYISKILFIISIIVSIGFIMVLVFGRWIAEAIIFVFLALRGLFFLLELANKQKKANSENLPPSDT